MLQSIETAACSCGDVQEDVVTLCSLHHIYRRGLRELVSVSKTIRTVWPFPPDFSKADPDVLENAKNRGIETDTLFSGYVAGTLQKIPAGTRRDSYDLFEKLRQWWDKQGLQAQSQIILADAETAGTCDLFIEGGRIVADLKTVYNVEATYPLQLGFYGLLALAQGVQAEELWIIHATARYAEPRLIQVPVKEAMGDAAIVRRMYSLVTRRTGKG